MNYLLGKDANYVAKKNEIDENEIFNSSGQLMKQQDQQDISQMFKEAGLGGNSIPALRGHNRASNLMNSNE